MQSYYVNVVCGLLITMYEAVTLEMVRELFESQDRSYRSTFQLLLTDRKEDVKSLEKDIDRLKNR